MQLVEFKALRAQISDTDDELAAELGVPVALLQRWSAGTERIPRFEARLIRFSAASAVRGRALEESGLPECAWLVDFFKSDLPTESDALLAALTCSEEHHTTCPVCQARERFVTEKFGPMPPYPTKGLMTVFALFDRLPASLRPAAYGASALAAIVSLRALFAIPSVIDKPALAVPLSLAILAAAAAGASGGFAFTFVRPTFKKLGRPGDYLTGIVCVGSYLTSLMLVAPFAFGERLMEGPDGWYIVGIMSLLFGSIVGHSWFGPSVGSTSSRVRAT